MRVTEEEAIRRGWMPGPESTALGRKATSPSVSAAPSSGPGQEESGKKSQRMMKRDAEGQEQAELVAEVRALYPVIGDLLIHIPNGGSRKSRFEGWRLKQQGTRAGVSDLLLPVARGNYHGLWIEFKATPPLDATVSAGQREWIALMQNEGYRACICLGKAAALTEISTYLALGAWAPQSDFPQPLLELA